MEISTGSWRPGDKVGWHREGGVLSVTRAGCVYLPNELGKVDLLWPDDYTATTGADGLVEVKNPLGQTVAEEGQPFLVNGATFNPSTRKMLPPRS